MYESNLPHGDLIPFYRRAHHERALAATSLVRATVRAVGDWAATIAAAHARRRLRRETVRQLTSLSNRTLQDIGIPRSAIWSVADDLVNAVTGPVADDHRHSHRARPTTLPASHTQARQGHHFTAPVTAGCG